MKPSKTTFSISSGNDSLNIALNNEIDPDWRELLSQYQEGVDPQLHGWIIDENGELDIQCMNCNPAPDEVS